MNSKIRTGLVEWAAGEAAAVGRGGVNNCFGMRCVDSISAGLRYKILTLLDDFPLTLPTNNVTKQALIQIIQNMSCIQIIQNMSCDVVFDFPTQCRFPLSSFYVFAPEIVLGSDEVSP